MIYPKRNLLIKSFFEIYLGVLVCRNFYKIISEPVDIAANKSVLLFANHFSWWDGVVLYWLNQHFFKKKFHAMMLEETISRFPFMKYLGVFSVKKNSKDILNSLGYASGLLGSPNNLLLIFPQKKLSSNFIDDIQFENGVKKIVENAPNGFEIIFSALFIENLAHKKPSAYVYFEKLLAPGTPDQLNYSYQQFYQRARERQQNIV